MHLLEAVASAEQKERYLRPLAAGAVRSAFAMTEPAPGAGSDPTMLLTTARRDGADWVIHGHKHLITGADGCAFHICMARTADEIRHDEGATMFLVDSDNPGVRVERLIPTMDRAFPGGHAAVVFERCRVPAEAVLGEVGLGYRYAQVRLAPARLTHCMRWLGLARRSLDIALDRAGERLAFGETLLDLGLVQALVADSVIDIEASRALIRTCAEVLDAGGRGTHESSVAKVFVSEAVGRIVDRSLQMCGGLGASDELPLGALRPRGARVQDLRRAERDASLVDRAARRAPPPARAVNGPVDVVDTPEEAARLPCPRSWCAARSRPGSASTGSERASSRATRIGSGHSNATFLLERGGRRMVLRRAPRPPLPPSAHDMLREARVLTALGGRARVPRVLAVCDDEGRAGRALLRHGGAARSRRDRRAAGHACDGRRAAQRRARPRRRARGAARGGHRGCGPDRVRAAGRLSRAPAPALHDALGAQRHARAAARRRARRLARRSPAVLGRDVRRARRLPPRQRHARARAPARARRCSTGSSRRSATRSPTSATSSRAGRTNARRRPCSTSRP